MKNLKKATALLMTTALTAMIPMQVFAENPQFAHDEATWAKLRDNVMEYDELQQLVEEYNDSYKNNLTSYKDTKSDDDAETIRQDLQYNADDMASSAEDMKENAEDLLDFANMLQSLPEDAANSLMKEKGISSVSSLMSAYSAMTMGAAMTSGNAVKQQVSADSSYVDNEMKKIQYMQKQTGLVVSTQSLFDSYHLLNNSLPVIQKNVEVLEAVYNSTQTRAANGMATQADVLLARKNVQSLQATYTESQSNLASVRQNLCMMTGWQYDAQPEIKEVPAVDINRILNMNPDTDKQAALDNNYDLQYFRREYANMDDNSTDRKNMERTIKSTEDKIGANLKNLYNDVLQKKTAMELADAELVTETTKMNSVETKYGLGMASSLEYLQEQAAFYGKQIEQQTANISLFQAMETYDWALKGYMNIQ